MERFRKVGLVGICAVIGQSTAVAQSAFEMQSNPSEIHGYDLDVDERDGSDVENRALEALRNAGSSGQDIQMLYSIERISFIKINPENLSALQAEIDVRQEDLTNLRTAIEASTLFFSALRSEGLDHADVIGVEISEVEGGLPSEKRAAVFLARP